jgi:hypothetical protein
MAKLRLPEHALFLATFTMFDTSYLSTGGDFGHGAHLQIDSTTKDLPIHKRVPQVIKHLC